MKTIILLSLIAVALGEVPNVYYYNRPIAVRAPLAHRAPTVTAPAAPLLQAPINPALVSAPVQHYHQLAYPIAPVGYGPAVRPLAYGPAPVAYVPMTYATAPVVGHHYSRTYPIPAGYPAVPRPQPIAPEYQTLQQGQQVQQLQQGPQMQQVQQLQQGQQMQQVQQLQQGQQMQQVPAEQNTYQATGAEAQSYQQNQQQVPVQSSYRNNYGVVAGSPVEPTTTQQQDAEQYQKSMGREVKYTIRDPQDPNGRMRVVEMQIQSDRQMSPAEAEKMMKNVMGSMGMRNAQATTAPEQKMDAKQNFNSFLREIGFGSGF